MKDFTSEGMRLLRVPISENAALKRSPHNVPHLQQEQPNILCT